MGKKKKGAATRSLFEDKSDAGNTLDSPVETEFPLPDDLDSSWLRALTPETRKPYWEPLQQFVADEREK